MLPNMEVFHSIVFGQLRDESDILIIFIILGERLSL